MSPAKEISGSSRLSSFPRLHQRADEGQDKGDNDINLEGVSIPVMEKNKDGNRRHRWAVKDPLSVCGPPMIPF
jgi:hypothetical protein